MPGEQRRQLRRGLLDHLADVRRLELRGRLGADAHGSENRVDQPVQALHLLHRRAVPAGPALAPIRSRDLRPSSGGSSAGGPCRRDDRERRPQLMGHERDQLGPGVVDLLQLRRSLLGLALHPALLDDAAQEVGDRAEVGHVGRREVPRLLGLDVEHADRSVVPDERYRQHRGDEPFLVDAADPQEALVPADVRNHQRLARRRDAAGDAASERDPRPPDLVAVEAVRRGKRQVLRIAIEEVERRHARPEGVPRLVDDRLEELLPRARRRGHARDPMQELQLLELFLGRAPGAGRPVGADRGAGTCGLRHPATIAEAAAAPTSPVPRSALRSCRTLAFDRKVDLR